MNLKNKGQSCPFAHHEGIEGEGMYTSDQL